jgi:hypothetical protein
MGHIRPFPGFHRMVAGGEVHEEAVLYFVRMSRCRNDGSGSYQEDLQERNRK